MLYSEVSGPLASSEAGKDSPPAHLPRRDGLLLAALLVAAAAVRFAAARSELWLDEIWSLSFAREAASPWQILSAIHHDNNHPLNTLALFLAVKLAGAHAPSFVYRILPLITGIATIPLIFWTEWSPRDRESRPRAWIAACLAATSFLAVVYSSEARGYAPVAFFALAAFALVRRAGLAMTPARRLAFAAFCALGILSHLTFLFPYAGLLAWTLSRTYPSRRLPLREWIALHRLPVACMAAYYAVDVRRLSYGGGPSFEVPEVLGRAFSLVVGGPNAGVGRHMAALAAVCVVSWSVRDLARRGSDEAVFFVGAVFLAPAAILIGYQARFLDARYFFVLFPFIWILAARALARLRMQGAAGRLLSAALVVLSVAGSLLHIRPLLRDGRGRYAEAVATMTALTTGHEVTVGSPQDFRSRMMLDYYGDALTGGKTLAYVPSGAWTAGAPEWVLTDTSRMPGTGPVPPSEIAGSNGNTYVWIRSFPYGGISGWNWHLYRRAE